MQGILASIAACHANQIIHRNVKPSKFLIGEDGNCRMTSFTSSLMGGGTVTQRPLMPRMGTTQYLAPEVLLGAADLELDYTSYTEKVDMWAAGLILAEMAAGGPLFVVDSEIDLLFSIFRMLGTPDEESWPGLHDLACSIENFPNWPVETRNLEQTFSILGSSGCDLLKKLLRYDAASRISAVEALRHPFFSQHGCMEAFTLQTESVPHPLLDIFSEGQLAVWSTLLEKQADMPPTKDFLECQDAQESGEKLTVRMRAILVDWLAEVSYSWCLRAERRALHAAVQCLDRFLSMQQVSKSRLQLVGATCYALAAKLEEAEVISPSGYAHISDFAFKEDDMRECEIDVASALGCRFTYASAPDFEPLVAAAIGVLPNELVKQDSEIPQIILIAQMLADYMLLGFHVGKKAWSPVVTCCSAYAVAAVTLNIEIHPALLCQTDEDSMCACISDILTTYDKAMEWELKNLHNNPKYPESLTGIELPAITYACGKVSEAYDRL